VDVGYLLVLLRNSGRAARDLTFFAVYATGRSASLKSMVFRVMDESTKVLAHHLAEPPARRGALAPRRRLRVLWSMRTDPERRMLYNGLNTATAGRPGLRHAVVKTVSRASTAS